jgi:hypothetical protein
MTPRSTEAERKVIYWVFVPVLAACVIWITISAWRATRECTRMCIMHGYVDGELHTESLARGVAASCKCVGPQSH